MYTKLQITSDPLKHEDNLTVYRNSVFTSNETQQSPLKHQLVNVCNYTKPIWALRVKCSYRILKRVTYLTIVI
jgi:hypothetical protein